MWRTWILALIGSLVVNTVAAADQIDDLVGRWQGDELIVSNGAERITEDVNLAITGSSNGFTVSLSLGDQGLDSVSFSPTSKPGVFAIEESGGLFSMFSGDSSADPLKGEPLIWARLTEPGIAIYNLQIDRNGHFRLADFRCERDGNSVRVRYLENGSQSEPRLVEALLTEEG